MVRMRGGSPKNMNQGIYWVQNAVRAQRNSRQHTRNVTNFKLRYDTITLKLIAEDEDGPLPPRYVNEWVKNNEKEAIELAKFNIKALDNYYWLDKRLKFFENNLIYVPEKPAIPCYDTPPPSIFVKKESLIYKIPKIGNWLLLRAINNENQRNHEIEKILMSNNTKLVNYNATLKEYHETIKINNLTDLDWMSNLKNILDLNQLHDHCDNKDIEINIDDNNVIITNFKLNFTDEKTNGYNKNINRILIKKKTKSELTTESDSTYFLIACIICKYAYLRGYNPDITVKINSDKKFVLTKENVLSNGFAI